MLLVVCFCGYGLGRGCVVKGFFVSVFMLFGCVGYEGAVCFVLFQLGVFRLKMCVFGVEFAFGELSMLCGLVCSGPWSILVIGYYQL